MPDPSGWFLRYADPSASGAADLRGLPWGAGTAYAARASAANPVPYDAGCAVEPIIGGYWAMSDIRDALVACLAAARTQKKPPGQNGLVYIAGWRCNPLRDLSSANSWHTSPWMSGASPVTRADHRDETVLGLLVSLIEAGVMVRVMVWMPTMEQDLADPAHSRDHFFLASAIRTANKAAMAARGTTTDIGVCCLDMRVTPGAIPVGSHHQKMCVVRYADATPPVAFVGGVDLAYTRRDAPLNPNDPNLERSPSQWFDGDWQSGASHPAQGTNPPWGMPALQDGWPFGDASTPASLAPVRSLLAPTERKATDLNDRTYGETRHRWHDQHMKLHGPVVATVQQQFCERWVDAGYAGVLPEDTVVCQFLGSQHEAWFSSASAIAASDLRDMDKNTIVPLPPVAPVAPVDASAGGTAQVQLWRTIPARPRGKATLFAHGEFTVMAGMARAMGRATKIAFICDQYFWSIPAARLLNLRVRSEPDLAVVIILPPHADATDGGIRQASAQHHARRLAFANLAVGMTAEERSRVGVFNAWDPVSGEGVYVHAKAHVYDGELYVCGSANINRRSMTGDTELALAVYDPPVVTNHLKALWKLFSGRAAWPTGPTGAPYDPRTDPGRILLDALRAVNLPNVIPDPQWVNPTATQYTLPNGAPLDTRPRSTYFPAYYSGVMESCSLEIGEIENPSTDLAWVSATVETPAWFRRVGRSPKTTLRMVQENTPLVIAP